MFFRKAALERVFDKYSYFGEKKHKFNQQIINSYSLSNNSNDILAVAISYLGEGAKYRKQAIEYFEKYLKFPSDQKYFSSWFIYSSLADLYEKEYMFKNALTCLQILTKLDNNSNCADYIRMGNILTKIDVNEAVKFYEDLKKESFYNMHKDALDNAYKDVLLKKQTGYKYKARKK